VRPDAPRPIQPRYGLLERGGSGKYPEVIDARQHPDPRARRACRKQWTQYLRIDHLVVDADKNQRFAVKRAQIIGIFKVRMIRGMEPVGIDERLGSIPVPLGLVEFDDRQSVVAVDAERVERDEPIEALPVQIGRPPAVPSLTAGEVGTTGFSKR
jgi:hypothetical protein